MSSQPNPQHLAWVDRLFARFSAIWGAQKLGAMFPSESHGEVRDLWAAQIGRFEPATIGVALQAMTDAGREWPPSLSEFAEACRQASIARRAHAPAVALPLPKAAPDVVAKALKGIGAIDKPRDPLRWARYPKSAKAVEFLLIGARRDHRLLTIAREHVAEGGRRIQCEAGRRYLESAAESNPLLRDAA